MFNLPLSPLSAESSRLPHSGDLYGRVSDLEKNNIPRFPFAALPAPSDFIGNVYVSDIGTSGSLWRSNGSVWAPIGGEVILHQSNTAGTALTGSTTETLLEEFLIPGGLLGENGGLEIFHRLNSANSANTKTFRCRVSSTGGTGGTNLNDPQWTTNATITCRSIVDNAGAQNSQIGSNGNPLLSGSSNAWRTSAINTANNWYLSFTGQLANAADSIQIVSTVVKLVRA